MKTEIFLLFALLATPTIAAQGDLELSNNIVGKWWNRISNSHIASEATEDFRADGTLITKGDVYANGTLVDQYIIKSTWKIKDGYSLVEVVESSNPNTIPIGLKISDKVVSIDEKEFVYEAADGTQHTLMRLNN